MAKCRQSGRSEIISHANVFFILNRTMNNANMVECRVRPRSQKRLENQSPASYTDQSKHC